MASRQPLALPTLLSRTLGHFTAELEAVTGVGTTVPSLAVWSNVLRCVADAGPNGLDERDLSRAARISRRLATAAVTGAARRGWISAELAGRGKNRHVRLTDGGGSAARIWPDRLADFDAAWTGTPLRVATEALVGRLEFELPHFPATYGTADLSAIAGPYFFRSNADGTARHGKDWTPVPRSSADTVSALPLTALLSQALMAFTIDYENRFPWPLASTATVLCHLTADPRPLIDVPGDHGITGTGKSGPERHGMAVVTRDPADARTKLVALAELRAQLDHVAGAASPDLPDHVLAAVHRG